MLVPEQIIDRVRYPLDEPGHERVRAIVREVRRELDDDGCAVVPGFLGPAGLELLRTEAAERAGAAYYSDVTRCNVYLGDPAPELGAEHPRNLLMERSNGFVTADRIGPETGSWQLYHWPPLARFIADCLDKPQLHLYADPVSNMIVNVAHRGQRFNWHFDTNEFTITMLLRAAEAGGHFEYVPDLRTPHDEHYDDVRAVIAGDRSRVRRLALEPGDLQLFLGRYSLHRVTANEGSTDRLLLIMSFTEQPDLVGSLARVKRLYGTVSGAHVAASGRHRADDLLD